MAEAKSEQLYKRFIAAALLVALTVGFTLGAINLTRIAAAVVRGYQRRVETDSRACANLWMGRPIYHGRGVACRAAIQNGGVAVAAGSERVSRLDGDGSYRADIRATVCLAVVVAGVGVMELASVGIFVWLLAAIAGRSKQTREFYEKFIGASIGWFAVLAVWNMSAVALMFTRGVPGNPAGVGCVDDSSRAVWVHLQYDLCICVARAAAFSRTARHESLGSQYRILVLERRGSLRYQSRGNASDLTGRRRVWSWSRGCCLSGPSGFSRSGA